MNLLHKLKEKLRVLNMIPCECGCRDDHWDVKDTMEGLVCEAAIICDNCGKQVNYWAYGCLEYPETYSELIAEKVWMFEYRMKLLWKNMQKWWSK